MHRIYLYLFLCVSYSLLVQSAQPFFPSQIVFSPNNGVTTIAIDEINQRAYQSITMSSYAKETTYVMNHFPYAIPDSPQSKSYVQLLVDTPTFVCMYGTYWKYGGSTFNSFPAHWTNGTSFEINNYMSFNYPMTHSTDSASDEDYWYANVTCTTTSGDSYPCEEIYFKKGTEMPLRSTRVARGGWDVRQMTTYYKVISMEKPVDKLFDSIPQDWSRTCRDVMLGLLYYPQSTKINLTEGAQVQVWLTTPPHRINGNDTVTIQWKPSQCPDCFTWTPQELSFNSANFQDRQTVTVTRAKASPKITLIPVFNGGGFDVVPADIYPLYIE